MDFENDILLVDIANALKENKSVIVRAKLYTGNGKYREDKYQYKMLVPFFSAFGDLYSTDIFQTVEAAKAGEYQIYNTQQLATEIVEVLEADQSVSRFGHGYTDEVYGRYNLEDFFKNVRIIAQQSDC